MAGWIAGAVVGSSVIGALGANSAADTQAQAAQNAQNQQLAMFNKQNAYLAPYRATGYNALNAIGSLGSGEYEQYDANGNPIGLATGSGYLTHQFNNNDLNANLSPNYKFQLEQGLGGVRNLANSSGGFIGGNAQKGLIDYNQNFAGNAYQNAFNNYQTQRSNIYNTLANIAGIGTGTNNTGANIGINSANSISSLGIGAANASAAGTIGMTNAFSGGLNNLGNYGYINQLLGQNESINPYSQLPTYPGSNVNSTDNLSGKIVI